MPEWLLRLAADLMCVCHRLRAYLGRPENGYIAVGMLDAPDPESLGFSVGNPRAFAMLSADPVTLMPHKVLGGGRQQEGE